MIDPGVQAAGWLDGLPEAVLVLDGERIAAANAGADHLLDAPAGSLAGTRLTDIVHDEEHDRLTRLVERARAHADVPRPLRVRLSRISDRGEVPVDLRVATAGDLVVLCARDATATARAEDLIGYLAQLTGTAETFADVDALLETSEPIFQALGWSLVFFDIVAGEATVRRFIRPVAHPPEATEIDLNEGDHLPAAHTVGVSRAVETGRSVRIDDVPGALLAARPEAGDLAGQLAAFGLLRAAYCPVPGDEDAAHVVVVAAPDLSDWDFVAIELFAAQLGSTLRLTGLQAEMVARERLAGLGDLNTEFARRLSHSAAIIDEAAAHLEGALSGEVPGRQLLSMLREEVERLGRLALDLLAFARPVTTEVVPLDLSAVIEAALAAARREISTDASGIEVQVDLPADLPRIAGDAQLLPEALSAMLVNAFQHEGARRIHVAAVVVDAGVEVLLENDGPSIPAEVAPRVFEPFFTTKATGTGLGLAMVRRTVEELGGTVDAEPWDGGARFRLVLRAAR